MLIMDLILNTKNKLDLNIESYINNFKDIYENFNKCITDEFYNYKLFFKKVYINLINLINYYIYNYNIKNDIYDKNILINKYFNFIYHFETKLYDFKNILLNKDIKIDINLYISLLKCDLIQSFNILKKIFQ